VFSAHAAGKNGSQLAAFRVADVRIIKIPALGADGAVGFFAR